MDAAVVPLRSRWSDSKGWDQQRMGSAFGKPMARKDFMGLRGLMRGDITGCEKQVYR
jgi:hypothetical protein